MTKAEFIKQNHFDNYSFPLKDGRVLEGWFVDGRVDKTSVPDGLHAYDCREDDDLLYVATIEKGDVVVNHGGTFLTESPIDFGGDDYLEVDNSDMEDDLMMWSFGYTDEDLDGYEILCWPESQNYLERKGFNQNAYLINDEEGLDKYGSAAYVVDKAWRVAQK